MVDFPINVPTQLQTCSPLQAIGSAALPITVVGVTDKGLFLKCIFQFAGTAFNDEMFEGEPVPKHAEHLRKRLIQMLIVVSVHCCFFLNVSCSIAISLYTALVCGDVLRTVVGGCCCLRV